MKFGNLSAILLQKGGRILCSNNLIRRQSPRREEMSVLKCLRGSIKSTSLASCIFSSREGPWQLRQSYIIRRYDLQSPALTKVTVLKISILISGGCNLKVAHSPIPMTPLIRSFVVQSTNWSDVWSTRLMRFQSFQTTGISLYPWSLPWTFKFTPTVKWANLNLIKSSLKWFASDSHTLVWMIAQGMHFRRSNYRQIFSADVSERIKALGASEPAYSIL